MPRECSVYRLTLGLAQSPAELARDGLNTSLRLVRWLRRVSPRARGLREPLVDSAAMRPTFLPSICSLRPQTKPPCVSRHLGHRHPEEPLVCSTALVEER